MKNIFIVCMTLAVLVAKDVTAQIKIDGMTCPMCTTAIKKSLKKVRGVSKAKVKLNIEIATVTFDETVKHEALLEAVKDVGYKGEFISVK